MARDDIEHLRLSAMRIQQQQPAYPGARDALAQLDQQMGEGLGGEKQRAGIGDMLLALADALDRQRRDRQVGGGRRQGAIEQFAVDAAIDEHRQMRPVLLDRTDRKHGDGVSRQPAELRPAHVLPAPTGKSAIVPHHTVAVMTSSNCSV